MGFFRFFRKNKSVNPDVKTDSFEGVLLKEYECELTLPKGKVVGQRIKPVTPAMSDVETPVVKNVVETTTPQAETSPEILESVEPVETLSDVTPELEPVPSQMAPFMVEMIKGRSYKLCLCGQSKKHPFCDSSHEQEGCQHKPYIFKPTKTGFHSICGCMESHDYPICDGTHDLLL